MFDPGYVPFLSVDPEVNTIYIKFCSVDKVDESILISGNPWVAIDVKDGEVVSVEILLPRNEDGKKAFDAVKYTNDFIHIARRGILKRLFCGE